LKLRLLLLVALLLAAWLGAACSANNNNSSPSATATIASQAQVKGAVVIDFTGAPTQRPKTNAPFAVDDGAKALAAIQAAIGTTNVSTKDFGGELGVFVTGFFGVVAEGNHFWEFSVNGKSSDVGAGNYVVKDGDVLSFKYSSF
jgi:hypothetical protein